MEPGTILSINQSPSTPRLVTEMQNVPYKEIVGSFAWAALGSRPDISFPTSILSQFLQNPGRAHWEAMKRCRAGSVAECILMLDYLPYCYLPLILTYLYLSLCRPL